MMSARSNHKILWAALVLTLGGCTAITGASDFKVDPKLDLKDGGAGDDAGDRQDAGSDASSLPGEEDVTRSLQFTLKEMFPHPDVAVDVAVVNESAILQARARIVMPKRPSETDPTLYPDVEVKLNNALAPGKYKLLIFADNDGDGLVDFRDNGPSAERSIIEHVWVVDVPPSGVGELSHNAIPFKLFDETEYVSLNGDLIMVLPMAPAALGIDVLKCIEAKLPGEVEVRLTLQSSDRQVGLFRRSPATPIPTDGVRLRGIIDGGNLYQIDVLVDGMVKRTLSKSAPATGNLEVPASEWFPISLDPALDCL